MGKALHEIYMVFLNGWISIVYYMMYCGARGHHHILAIFWGVIAVLWLWDLFTGYTPFERNPKYKVLVGYSMQCLSSTRSFRGHAEWNFP